MTPKSFGYVRGMACAVGDTLHWRNKYGQRFTGTLCLMFVESECVLVKRNDWPSQEIIDLSDVVMYPLVSRNLGPPWPFLVGQKVRVSGNHLMTTPRNGVIHYVKVGPDGGWVYVLTDGGQMEGTELTAR